MAKKRKISRKSEPTGPREIDAKDARLTIKTYQDVANSEDEYYADKDRIDFDSDDGGRSSKRRKRQQKEEEFLEASDEEIFGEDDSEDDDEDDEEDEVMTKKGKKKGGEVSDDEEEKEAEEEGDEGWWGAERKEYYNADAIETEADALVCGFGGKGGDGDVLTLCREKKPRREGSRRRSWPRCRRLILLLTKLIGLHRKNRPGKMRRWWSRC